MRKLASLVTVAVVLVGFLGVVGCGDDTVDTYDVKGTLKITGVEKIPMGTTVEFHPKEGNLKATGLVNEAGAFTLTTYEDGDGAAEGDYKVVVRYDATAMGKPGTPIAPPPSGGGPPMAAAGVTIDPKYGSKDSTPLEETVSSDESKNNFTFTVEAAGGGAG